MTERPLRDGVLRTLGAVLEQERSLFESFDRAELEVAGQPEAPSIKELVAEAGARRRFAAGLLRDVIAGMAIDPCLDPPVSAPSGWEETRADAHQAMTELQRAMMTLSEEQLAADPGPPRDHPQYLWREVFIQGVRGPVGTYATYLARTGQPERAVETVRHMYDEVAQSTLPAKATSDMSYDLACMLAVVGRADEAMELLPDAFSTNDPEAVPVLKAWAQEDPDLRVLRHREDFRRLVTV